jgi:hypothetical protein
LIAGILLAKSLNAELCSERVNGRLEAVELGR